MEGVPPRRGLSRPEGPGPPPRSPGKGRCPPPLPSIPRRGKPHRRSRSPAAGHRPPAAGPGPQGCRRRGRRVSRVTARTGAAIFPPRHRRHRRSGRGGEGTAQAPAGPASHDRGGGGGTGRSRGGGRHDGKVNWPLPSVAQRSFCGGGRPPCLEGLARGTRAAPPPCWKRRAGEAAMLGRSALRRRWQGGSLYSPAASQAPAAALLLTSNPFPGSPPQPAPGEPRLGVGDPSCLPGQSVPRCPPWPQHVAASPLRPGRLLRQRVRWGWPCRERRGDPSPSLKDSMGGHFATEVRKGGSPRCCFPPWGYACLETPGLRFDMLTSCGVTLFLWGRGRGRQCHHLCLPQTCIYLRGCC